MLQHGTTTIQNQWRGEDRDYGLLKEFAEELLCSIVACAVCTLSNKSAQLQI